MKEKLISNIKKYLPTVLAVFAVTGVGLGIGIGSFYAAAWLTVAILLGVG